MENIDLLIMFVGFTSAFIGYWLGEENPLAFDTVEAHSLLSVIVAVSCAFAAIGLYVLCL